MFDLSMTGINKTINNGAKEQKYWFLITIYLVHKVLLYWETYHSLLKDEIEQEKY